MSALSESLHYELAPFGVRVVVVEPGPYATTRFLINQVIARCTPDSPYADVLASFRVAMTRLAGSDHADPQEVADAIYAAVYSDTPRFRYVVGDSARRIAEMRKHSDFEDFERSLRGLLDWHVGAPQEVLPAG